MLYNNTNDNPAKKIQGITEAMIKNVLILLLNRSSKRLGSLYRVEGCLAFWHQNGECSDANFFLQVVFLYFFLIFF